MIAFDVKDMTCGHCERTITQALKQADPAATVQIDLAQHRVTVGGATLEAPALAQTIQDAGYTPVLREAPAADTLPAAQPRRAGGCCCGS
jgi:copper chaperone